MTTAVSTLPISGAGFGSFRKVLTEIAWVFGALGAASRVASAVRNHQIPSQHDLQALGLRAAQFPRTF